MLRAARTRLQKRIGAPLIGVILVARKKCQRVITYLNGANPVRPSAEYIASSLSMLPKSIDIIDCRNGYTLLKQRNRFFIWDPFERGRWMAIPEQPSSIDNILAAVLIGDGDANQCSLLLLCELEGLVVLQIFDFACNIWRRSITSLSLDANEHVPQPGVHCDNLVYFFTSREKIVRVDIIQATADTIHLPDSPNYSQKILSRVNGLLCLATADVAHVCVSLYQNDTWHMQWKRRAPRTALRIKVVGYAEENGLLLVETSPDRSHVLDVEDGVWTQLEAHLSADVFFPLEINTPFRHPFPSAAIDGSRFVDNSLDFKKNDRKLLKKQGTTEGYRNAIRNLFDNQDK